VAKPRRKLAKEHVKQPVIVAVKVPASPTSTTAPAKKLLEAIGRPATTPKRRRKVKRAAARAKAKRRAKR
jgi:hypothetical protein